MITCLIKPVFLLCIFCICSFPILSQDDDLQSDTVNSNNQGSPTDILKNTQSLSDRESTSTEKKTPISGDARVRATYQAAVIAACASLAATFLSLFASWLTHKSNVKIERTKNELTKRIAEQEIAIKSSNLVSGWIDHLTVDEKAKRNVAVQVLRYSLAPELVEKILAEIDELEPSLADIILAELRQNNELSSSAMKRINRIIKNLFLQLFKGEAEQRDEAGKILIGFKNLDLSNLVYYFGLMVDDKDDIYLRNEAAVIWFLKITNAAINSDDEKTSVYRDPIKTTTGRLDNRLKEKSITNKKIQRCIEDILESLNDK